MRILQAGTSTPAEKTVRARAAVIGFLSWRSRFWPSPEWAAVRHSRPTTQHGISFTKGCVSPTQIGQPYTCAYSIRNIIDDAQDTLTIDSLSDTVHSSGGDVSSGNALAR